MGESVEKGRGKEWGWERVGKGKRKEDNKMITNNNN
jgi:hypothetical protein